MKVCSECGIEKDDDQFFRYKKTGTLRCACKQCTADKVRENRRANPDRSKATNLRNAKNDYQRRKDAISAYKKSHYAEKSEDIKVRCNANYYVNHEENKRKQRLYAKLNPELRNFTEQRRRARKLNAEVKLQDSDLHDLALREASRLVHLRNKMTGIKWNVDHIIPLQNKSVCGLHTWTNIQVIPAIVNIRKGNRFTDTEVRRV